MDIFKSSYIYIYMQGITNTRGMPSSGARSFPGEEGAAPLRWVQRKEGAHKEHLATAGRGQPRAAPPPAPQLRVYKNLISLVLKQFVMGYLKNKSD